MSATLELIAAELPHGSQAGYDAGCRGQGGCANHGSSELLTCVEAAEHRRQDWKLAKLPRTEPITRAMVRLRSDRELAQTTPARPSTAPRRTVAPSRPMPAAVEPSRSPSSRSARTSRPARRTRPRTDGPVHGTCHGFARGCKTDEECPNTARGLKSCAQAQHEYREEYTARRRAGVGPTVEHGTEYGYQLGCRDRETCPGSEDGLTCPDARVRADRQRARNRGVPLQRPLVPSAPTLAHLAQLRAAGMTLPRLIEESGVGRTALRTLIYGRDDYTPDGPGPRHGEVPARIDAEKARRILAVKIPAVK